MSAEVRPVLDPAVVFDLLDKLDRRCTLLQQELDKEKHSKRLLEERMVAVEKGTKKPQRAQVGLISPAEFRDACAVLESDEGRLISQAQNLQRELAEKCNSCNYKRLNDLRVLVQELDKVSKVLRKASDDLNKNPSIIKVLKAAPAVSEKKPSCTAEQFMERLQSPCCYLDVLLYQPEFAVDTAGGGTLSVWNEVITLATLLQEKKRKLEDVVSNVEAQVNPIMTLIEECQRMMKDYTVLEENWDIIVNSWEKSRSFLNLLARGLPAIKRNAALRRELRNLCQDLKNDMFSLHSKHSVVPVLETLSSAGCVKAIKEDEWLPALKISTTTSLAVLQDALQKCIAALSHWKHTISHTREIFDKMIPTLIPEFSLMEETEQNISQYMTSVARQLELREARNALSTAKTDLHDFSITQEGNEEELKDRCKSAHLRVKEAERAHYAVVKKLALYFNSYHPIPIVPPPGKEKMYEALTSILSKSTFEQHELEDVINDLEMGPVKNVQYGTLLLPQLEGHPPVAPIKVVVKAIQCVHHIEEWIRFQREVTILRRAVHQNIVPFVDAFVSVNGQTGYVITKRAELGDLASNTFTAEQVESIVYGVASALQHLHGLGILHCDIKPQNIVRTEAGVPQLIDFDTSTSQEERMRTITNTVGVSAKYVAPEVTQNHDYGTYSDMYSFGKVINEILPTQVRDRKWESLIQNLMNTNPKLRPNATAVLGMIRSPQLVVPDTQTKFRASLPLTWEGTMQFQVVPLDSKSVAKDIVKLFSQAVDVGKGGRDQLVRVPYNKLEVVSVHRVENLILWSQYTAVRERIITTHLRDGTKSESLHGAALPEENNLFQGVNEMYLWHGTGVNVAHLIASGGFDERVCSPNGLVGAGIYFASDPSKSDQYSKDEVDEPGVFCMILSRVVMGCPCITDKGIPSARRPPQKSEGGLYDSVVFRQPKYRFQEYVVYDRYQTYPEFIIKYKRTTS